MLAACGPIDRAGGSIVRTIQGGNRNVLRWEAIGASKEFVCTLNGVSRSGISFLEASTLDLSEAARITSQDENLAPNERKVLGDFIDWLESKPA